MIFLSQTIKTWSTPVCNEAMQRIPCVLCGGGNFRQSLVCEGFGYVICSDCSLVQINPQPLAGEVAKRYSDVYGDDYCNYEIKNEDAFLHLQKCALRDAGFYKLEKQLFAKTIPRVLDLGCATGAMLHYLKNRGWETAGVEISPAALVAKNSRGLNVLNTTLEDAHFPSEYFDLALASHLIEHLNNPGKFLDEIWRILKPGSYLLLTTPNICGFQAVLFGSNWRSAIFDHLCLFSVHTIRKMLKRHGFLTKRIYTWGGLAAGTAPAWLKNTADFLAKTTGWGDVMLVKAQKPEI